jgi:hypothetical protein
MLNEWPKPCWSILSRLTVFEVPGAFICLDRLRAQPAEDFRLVLARAAQADHAQSLRAVQATTAHLHVACLERLLESSS